MPERKRSLGWQDIFKCYPIFDSICVYLDPQDILSFRQTTRQLSPFFETLFRSQWNVNRALGRFVGDPVKLRSLLGSVGGLVSGGFAVGFFDRGGWGKGGCDVYVREREKGKNGLGEWLVEREGFVVGDVRTEGNGGLREFVGRVKHVSKVTTYVKKVPNKEEPIRIQILYTIGTPLKAILNGFRQTLVMNIISWNFAYSLFPDLSFIKRKTYGINGDDLNYKVDGEVNYERLGWKWEKAATEDDKNVRSLNLNNRRRIGDSYTWSIALDITGVEIGDGEPPSVLQHSFFKVEELFPMRSTPGQYIIHVRIVKSCVLKYEYTSSIAYYDPHAFWALIREKLDCLAHVEPVEFPEDDRRIEGQTEHADEIAGREPEGWTFYDEMVPRWYEEYVEKGEEAGAERSWFEKQAGNLTKAQKDALDG